LCQVPRKYPEVWPFDKMLHSSVVRQLPEFTTRKLKDYKFKAQGDDITQGKKKGLFSFGCVPKLSDRF